jgi:flagellar biosynthesis/type III secretory pathway protein FliH
MKPWHENLRFPRPLREVELVWSGPAQEEFERRAQQREQAAFEKGRQEGEKALSEQLLRQRGEVLELQQGVLNSLRQAVPAVIRDAEGVLVTLALEAARKLVADLPISPELVEATVRPWHKWRRRPSSMSFFTPMTWPY